jgi:hypothetical protein
MAMRSIYGPDKGGCGPDNCDGPVVPLPKHRHQIPDIDDLEAKLAKFQEDLLKAGQGIDGRDGVDGKDGADGIGAGGTALLDDISGLFDGSRVTFPLRLMQAIIPQDTILLVTFNGIHQHPNISYSLGNIPLEITFATAPPLGYKCQMYAFSKGIQSGTNQPTTPGGGGTGTGAPSCVASFNQPVAPTQSDNPCPNAIWLNSVTGTIYSWINGQWTMFNPKPSYGNESVGSLPTTGNYEGRIVYLEADGRLYIFKNGQWILFTTYLTPDAPSGIEVFASNPTEGNYEGRVIFNTTTNKLMKYVGGVWVQVVEPINAAAEVADASINIAKFAAGIRPVELVDVLPTTGNFEGRIVYVKQDDKLWRYTGTQWTAATAAQDITGTLNSTQIGENQILTGHLSANAVTSDKLVAGSVTAGKIAAGAVSTTELAAESVTATKLFAGAVFTKHLTANAVTTDKIAAGAVSADKIEANSITAGKIQAGAIGAAQIAGGAVTADKLGANSVVAGTIAASAVTTEKIAAGAVTTEKLTVGQAGNVIWNPCCYRTVAGWTFYTSVQPNLVGPALTTGHNAWMPLGFGAGVMAYTGAGQYWSNQYLIADWRPVDPTTQGVAAAAGEKWQARALLGTHRCDGYIQIIFSDSNNVVLGTAQSAVTNDKSGGIIDSLFASHTVMAVAPAGTTRVMLRIAGVGNGGTNPYVFFTKTMLSRAPDNALEVAPWSAGMTEINGGQIQTQSITAEQIAVGSLTADRIAAGQISADKLAAGEIITDQIQVRNLILPTNKLAPNAVTILAGTERYASDSGERYVPGSLTGGTWEVFQEFGVDFNSGYGGGVKMNFTAALDVSFSEGNGAAVYITHMIRWIHPNGAQGDYIGTGLMDRVWWWAEDGHHTFQYFINYKCDTAEGWVKTIYLGTRFMYALAISR